MRKMNLYGLVLFVGVTGVLVSGIVLAGDPPADTGTTATAPAKTGQEIWKGTCQVCHATGMLGAPKIGDKAAWAPRIAKGLDVLKGHAMHGFGEMPPKGGNDKLSDEDVAKAVEYMVGQSQ